jgi:hypothetical protein
MYARSDGERNMALDMSEGDSTFGCKLLRLLLLSEETCQSVKKWVVKASETIERHRSRIYLTWWAITSAANVAQQGLKMAIVKLLVGHSDTNLWDLSETAPASPTA